MIEEEALVLAPGMAEQIIAHARAGYPEEVCGIIAGVPGVAAVLYRGRNVSDTPRVAYELDVETLTRQADFEAQGLILAAIYHSHPHGPEHPSAADVAQAYYDESVYLICSLAAPDRPVLTAFRIQGGRVREVALAG